jgi:hypothetical protein
LRHVGARCIAKTGTLRAARCALSSDHPSDLAGWMFTRHAIGIASGRFHFGLFFATGLPDMR